MNREHKLILREWLPMTFRRWLIRASLVAASLLPGYQTLAATAEQAWSFFKAKDYDQAILEFNKVLQQYPDLADAYDGLGWSYYWRGDFEPAEMAFQKALKLNAGDKSATEGNAEVKKWRFSEFNAAWNSFYQGLYAEAAEAFLAVLNRTNQKLPAEELWKVHSGLGWSYYYLSNYSKAEEEFKAILAIDANNAYALKGKGFVLYQTGKYQEAEELLAKALEKEPTWQDSQSMIGWCHYSRNEYDKALERFEAALKANPYLADAAYGKAWALYRTNRKAEAQKAFKAALTMTPSHPSLGGLLGLLDSDQEWWPLYEPLGWSYYQAMMWSEAASTFGYALKKMPGEANLYLGLGYADFRLGSYTATIDALKYYISLIKEPAVINEPFVVGQETGQKALSDANSILGWSYLYLKQFDKAIKHFTDASTKHPAWSDPISGLGWCHYNKGEIVKAENFFNKALEISPTYEDARNGLTAAHKKRYQDFNAAWDAFYVGQYTVAVETFQQIVKSSLDLLDKEDKWKVYSGMGWSYLMSNNPKAAMDQFNQVLDLSPANPYALQGLARASCDAGDYNRGMEYLGKISEKDRDTIDVELLKGHCLDQTGRHAEAEEQYRKVAARWPESAAAFAGLGWTLLRQGKLAPAKDTFLHALTLAPNLSDALEGLNEIVAKGSAK